MDVLRPLQGRLVNPGDVVECDQDVAWDLLRTKQAHKEPEKIRTAEAPGPKKTAIIK